MGVDGDTRPSEDQMLPDEREVLEERGEQLAEADDDDLLTVDEVVENLCLDAE